MRLVAGCVACQSHFLVTHNLSLRQSHLETLRTKPKSTVLRNSHRVGQLFRFGLIGDMQAGQHTIVMRYNAATARCAFCVTNNLSVGK